jgi:hypothetical protein
MQCIVTTKIFIFDLLKGWAVREESLLKAEKSALETKLVSGDPDGERVVVEAKLKKANAELQKLQQVSIL